MATHQGERCAIMTTHPIPNGTRVRPVPREGVVVRSNPYTIKERGETRYSYLVQWEDGSQDNLPHWQVEVVEEEK